MNIFCLGGPLLPRKSSSDQGCTSVCIGLWQSGNVNREQGKGRMVRGGATGKDGLTNPTRQFMYPTRTIVACPTIHLSPSTYFTRTTNTSMYY